MELHERDERRAAAEARLGDLAEAGVVGVVLPWVDTSGITRMKSVPLARLPSAAQWGVGMSPVFDGFLVDDSIIAGTHAGSAIGDLRLQGQHQADAARGDHRPDPLVDGLGGGPQRHQQEGGVAVERNQLTDGDPALDREPGAQPHHRDHEHPGQGDLRGVGD